MLLAWLQSNILAITEFFLLLHLYFELALDQWCSKDCINHSDKTKLNVITMQIQKASLKRAKWSSFEPQRQIHL